jgi:predicted permease
LIAAVAVVSHRMWSEQFGADPGLVGRTVRLDEVPLEVVGVMPAAFEDPFGAQADVWLPQDMRLGVGNNFNNHYLSAVARLRDGITLEAAQERSRMLAAAFSEAQPEADGAVAAMRSLARDVVGETRRAMLLILAAAAGLVLLACCVNVMNLLLARGLSQDRRLAVCAALGSGRGRLAAMILTENGLLAAAGGVAGFALGLATVRWLPLIAPTALPNTADLIPGWPVFVFAATATGLAMLVFGLAPAIRLSRTGPLATLRSEDRASTGGRPAQRLRSTLVIVQVAAGIVLVAGATLLARSLGNLADVPLGVRPDGVLTFEVNLPQARYADGPARHALHEALEERVRALPGATAVGATSWLPVSGTYHTWGFLWDPNVPGTRDDDAWQSTDVRVITGDYFESIGIGIVRGIAPGEVDFEAEPVIWINERLAAEVFREIDPLGQQVWMEDAFRRIVGIVTDVAHDSRGATTRTLYLPHAQFSDDRNWALVQTVATQGDLGELRDAIAAELRSIDPQLVLYRPRPFADVLATARAQDRFATALMGAFAALALVLSLVGTYGVLSSGVAARRREIGIRMALGADAARVRKSVLRRAAALTVPGVGIGLMAAWLGSRWIDTLLFGVSAADPIGYVVPAALFLGVGLLAAWRPALRATQVDTVVALSGD